MELLQPLLVEEKRVWSHYLCGQEWFEEEIWVYKITLDGTAYIDLEMPEDISQYSIRKFKMKRGQYYATPEFGGF